MGKPVTQAWIEIDIVVSIYRYYADNGAAFLADEELAVVAGGNAVVRKEAVGPLLGIMPWNYPYYQVARRRRGSRRPGRRRGGTRRDGPRRRSPHRPPRRLARADGPHRGDRPDARLPRGTVRPRRPHPPSGRRGRAIALANNSPYGLGAVVQCDDEEHALRVADRLEAGMVYINDAPGTAAELPFGGIKRSGIGRELGRYGMDEFANKKLIRVKRQPGPVEPHPSPGRQPPPLSVTCQRLHGPPSSSCIWRDRASARPPRAGSPPGSSTAGGSVVAHDIGGAPARLLGHLAAELRAAALS